MNSSLKHVDTPIAGGGGIQQPLSTERDPFEVLSDIMDLVEALCPVWPPREITSGDAFRL